MQPTPKASVSRIFFVTDMTTAAAPEIPLGFLVEASWPGDARWLGLIGRTLLTAAELPRINLRTWPEMEKPFGMLDRLFDAMQGGKRRGEMPQSRHKRYGSDLP